MNRAGFARHMVLFSEDTVLAAGRPADLLTDATLGRAYACSVRVGITPPTPFLLPMPLS